MEKTYKRLKTKASLFFTGLICSYLLLSALVANKAFAGTIKIIADEETEELLQNIVRPLFRASGVAFNPENIFIVEDNSLNAFVADNNRLFVNTGTIIKADSVNELSGVLAHETGHIMGGHILRQKLKAYDLQKFSLISALLAGTSAVLSGRSDVAAAVMMGGQSSLITHYSAYRTGEERSADEAAVKLLKATEQSPKGILNFMKKINKQNNLSGIEEFAYFRTHPITQERINFFEKALAENKFADSNKYDKDFELVKAKLTAYEIPTKQSLIYYNRQKDSMAKNYALAVTYMKLSDFEKAKKFIDKAIKEKPENAYFYEIKGEICKEQGNIKEAAKYFEIAYKLKPKSDNMILNYAHSILESNDSKENALKVTKLLNKILDKNKNANVYMLLSRAYGILGDMGKANYNAAEFLLRTGNIKIAENKLKEALKYKLSAKEKVKIQDIKLQIEQIKRKRHLN